MDRREALGTGLTFSAGLIGGGMTSGLLVFAHSESKWSERVNQMQGDHGSEMAEMRAENSFTEKIREGQADLDLNPGEHEVYHFKEAEGETRQLRYVILSDYPIDVLAMQRDEYEMYADDKDSGADTFASSLSTTHATSKSKFRYPISLVIDNTDAYDSMPVPSPNNIGVAWEIWV